MSSCHLAPGILVARPGVGRAQYSQGAPTQTGARWDSPELCLLELAYPGDVSVHLIQLPGKGRVVRLSGPLGQARGQVWRLSEGPLCCLEKSRSQGCCLPVSHPTATAPISPAPAQLLGSSHSPPPPGAAGHILTCQASSGSRCRGGQGAGTAHRALGAGGRDGCHQPPYSGPKEHPSGNHARTG